MTAFDLKMCGLELDGGFYLPTANPMTEPEDKGPYYLPDGLQVSYAEEASSSHTKSCVQASFHNLYPERRAPFGTAP